MIRLSLTQPQPLHQQAKGIHSTPKAKALILSRLFRELEIAKFPNFGHFHVTDSEQNVLKTVSCLFMTSIPHAWFIKSCFIGSTTSTITIRFQIDFAPCVGWHLASWHQHILLRFDLSGSCTCNFTCHFNRTAPSHKVYNKMKDLISIY